MSRAFEDQQIRRYLLGDISAADASDLEAAFFGDPELLTRVELMRDDLADDYAAGRLSEEDRGKLERCLLASNEGREQLAIARALRKAALEPGAPDNASPRFTRAGCCRVRPGAPLAPRHRST
jgi:hypothetical protein